MIKKMTAIVLACMLISSCSFSVSYGEETDGDNLSVEEPSETITEPTFPTYVGSVKKINVGNIKTNSAKLSWSRSENAEKYQIYKYNSKKKKYIYNKTVKNKSIVLKLKPNKTYKYKVRGYRVNDGKNIYGKFSKVKKFKTKKTPELKVIGMAKSKIGCSYVSGASGSKQFDCSGFVYWIFNNSDVSTKKKIKRTSCNGLYSSLKKYKVKSPKKGDIVLYKNGNGFTHTAIYIGNGNIIHAANPKKDVCKAKMKWCNGKKVYLRVLKNN